MNVRDSHNTFFGRKEFHWNIAMQYYNVHLFQAFYSQLLNINVDL